MANNQQAVSKPLLIILLVVAVAGIVYWVMNMGGGSPESEAPTDVTPVPEGFTAPEPPPGDPTPTAG